MARPKKANPLVTFEENLADAKVLLTCSRLLTTTRKNAMQAKVRNRIGDMLRIPKNRHHRLDCIDNDEAFIVFRDSEKLNRSIGKDVRPLLRQAIVASCAAMETYVADKVTDLISQALASETPPGRMMKIHMTVGDYLNIDRNYKRRGWGLRSVVAAAVREQASTAPKKVGETLGIIGVIDWSKKTDKKRHAKPGSTVEQLQAITDRRNQIAHSADRSGSGQASLSIEDTSTYLSQIEEIVHAIDKVIAETVIK